MVTVYKSITDVDSPIYYELKDVLKQIESPKQKNIIEKIRSLQQLLENAEKGSEEEKQYTRQKAIEKAKLTPIVFQGKFGKRTKDGLIEASELAIIDFDHVPDPAAYKDFYFDNHSFVHSAFISPSGDGVKLLVRIPKVLNDAEYKTYYRAILKYFDEAKSDTSTMDICRVCFISYDPEILTRKWEDTSVFTEKVETEKQPYKLSTPPLQQLDTHKAAKAIQTAQKMIQQAGDGQKHYVLLRAARLLGGYVGAGTISEQEAINILENEIQGKAADFARAQKTIAAGLKHGQLSPIYSLRLDIVSANNFKEPERTFIDLYDEELPKPIFPIEVFPDVIQEMITDFNKSLNFSVDFLAIAAMFSIATINGNKFKLRVKNGWDAATTFWFAAVGDPGTSKTHPINTLISPIKDIDAQSFEIYKKEKAIYDVAFENKEKAPKPIFKQVLINDFTLEALHQVHSFNPRGIGLYKDELVGFLNDMNKYRAGSDEQFWLESFNNGKYIVNRATKDPLMIENIMINIIGTIQPDVLTSVVAKYAGNGLVDRFLFTAAEENIYPMTTLQANPDFLKVWGEALKNTHTNLVYSLPEDTQLIMLPKDCFDKIIEVDKWFCNMQASENEKNIEHKEVLLKLSGKTKGEKILELHKKGYKQTKIAEVLNTNTPYVSKILSKLNK